MRYARGSFLLLLLLLPASVLAADGDEEVMKMPTVQGVMGAIGNVNQAMRDAAQNPLDDWRREKVQDAIRALPAAIVALAGDFSAGRIQPEAYPAIQAMMAGFADVNAVDGYKKFMQHPSADLIPQGGSPASPTGVGRPSGGSGSSSVVFDDSALKGASPVSQNIVDAHSDVKEAALKGISDKQDKALDSLRGTLDLGVRKSDVPKAPETESTISRLEAAMKSGFTIRRSPAQMDFQIDVKPKYWMVTPHIRFIERIILKEAHAEGGGEIAGILMGIAGIISAMAPEKIAKTQAEAEIAVAMIDANAQIQMTNISADVSRYVSNQAAQVTLAQTKAAERISKAGQDGVTQRLDMQLAELRDSREDAAGREKERLAEEKRLNNERIALSQKQADDNVKLARQSLNAQLTQAGLQTGFGNSQNSGNSLTSQVVENKAQGKPNSLGSTVASNSAASSLGVGKGVMAPITAPAESDQSGSTLLALLNSPNFASAPSTATGGVAPGGEKPASSHPPGPGPMPSNSTRAVAIDFRSRLLSSTVGSGGGGPSAEVLLSQSILAPGMARVPLRSVGSLSLVRGAAPAVQPSAVPQKNVRALAALLNGEGHRAVRGSTNGNRVAIAAEEPKPITRVLSQTIDRNTLRVLRQGSAPAVGAGHGGGRTP